MKKVNVLISLILVLGIGVMMYPFVSSWYNQRIQDQLIQTYESTVSALTQEEKEAEKEACADYNRRIPGSVVITDPFDPEAEAETAEEYEARLNINQDRIMGYLEIPVIDVRLNIYHGTTAEVLDKGVGHVEKSSLPIGGTGTHAVLSAHTAYAKAELFNNLVDLTEGDVFYLHVLDERLAYQVDQVKIVLPSDTSDLAINYEEDYVTLITCTPYGVNSHRLLVRGVRIPYMEENKEQPELNYGSYLAAAAVIIIILIILKLYMRRQYQSMK